MGGCRVASSGNLAHSPLDSRGTPHFIPAMISANLLLHAYRNGVFPMAMEDGEIAWFSPDPRAIIPLESFHIPHGLKRALKRNLFDIRVDTAFEIVIRECARRRETWINEEIIESYINLHRVGYAHSVEAWHNGKLAGGLYGVALGGAFFGESMFHHATDASKVALHALVQRLRARGFSLLDTQWTTPHLERFGVLEISRKEYLKRLSACADAECAFAD
jgi:leucyl/phenylalanyl-tRNA---protein transferase